MTMILITTVKDVTTMEAIETMFCLSSILIIFTKLFHQLWIKNFKNAWTKRMQKIPRKINVSIFSAKRKLPEKMNGTCLIDQVRSRMLPYTSQIAEKASFFSYLPFTFFQLPYLEHGFMITSLIRLNLIF